MATFDLQRLIAPVSPDAPCGPDLDLDGDAEYMNFVAGAEGRLPSSYFDGRDESGETGRPFLLAKTELDAVFAAAAPLLAKTRDLRLLVLLGKYSLLARQFDDFSILVHAVAALLSERWDEVHPRAEAGDLQARLVAVESLEVQPTILMPLQFLPLIEHRRFGTVTFRGYLIASGAGAPRENEEVTDQASVDKLIREVEIPALIARRDEFTSLRDALAKIVRAWSEKDDSGAMLHIDKLVELVGKIVAFLDGAVTLRDPAAALVPAGSDAGADGSETDGEAAEGMSSSRVTNQAEAGAALSAVADYLSQSEPSSPTLPLVRQASLLVGKSFIDVMRTLVPTHFEQAAIEIGRTESFSLPIERLATLTGEGEPAAAGATGEPGPSLFEVHSRAQALSLLDQVAAYFRAAEPSSPVPFLIERGRDLAQRDFLSVLKTLLPADTLRTADTLKTNGSAD